MGMMYNYHQRTISLSQWGLEAREPA